MREHGTATRYNYHRCRCKACRSAWSQHRSSKGYDLASQQKRRAERVEVDGQMVHPNPWGGHGTRTAYNSCACRCSLCREADRAYQARRKAAP